MSDRAGALVNQYGYRPFGADCSPAFSGLTLSQRFTGQSYDEAIGLYYYQSRYYDPAIARFIQPDTILPSFGSQGINRYSYCYNNPLKYTDPSGHGPEYDQAVSNSSQMLKIYGEMITDSDAGIQANIGAFFLSMYHAVTMGFGGAAPAIHEGMEGAREQAGQDFTGPAGYAVQGLLYAGEGYARTMAWGSEKSLEAAVLGGPISGLSKVRYVGTGLQVIGAGATTVYTGHNIYNLSTDPDYWTIENVLDTGLSGAGLLYYGDKFDKFLMKKVIIPYRKDLATTFMRDELMIPEDMIGGYMDGIDFNQKVRMVEFVGDELLVQYVKEYGLGRVGRFFAYPGTSPDELGIAPYFRRIRQFNPTPGTRALQSTAAPIIDKWSVRPFEFSTQGGGTQIMSNPNYFEIIQN